ncbi:Alpha/Beta hydrolase protein [Spinellus fusiger]|nr:Alpha/Beta hydrolase protein [Spinellus fusiger]
MTHFNIQSPSEIPTRNRAPLPQASKCQLVFDYQPSQDGIDLNLLILLHGLGISSCIFVNVGDTKAPFAKLGSHLKLPQTATMAVQAPFPVPYMEDSYQWFPSFDFLTGHLLPLHHPERIKGFFRTRAMMKELLQHVTQHCGFSPNTIFLFGFSQGGTVALDAALLGDLGFYVGGVVSISGYLLEELVETATTQKGSLFGGYVLITQGEKDAVVGSKAVAEKKFQQIQQACSPSAITSQVFITNKDHTMPQGEGEWRIIHSYFSKYMARRNIELESMADVYLVRPS